MGSSEVPDGRAQGLAGARWLRSRGPAARMHPAATVALAIALFFVLDGVLFRSGLYARYLQPYTPIGSMMAIVRFNRVAPTDPNRTVLVMGASKIEYGFGVRMVEEDFPGAPIQTVMGAFPGSNEEHWYYALRQIDPHHNRYAAIVIPMPGYKAAPYDDGFRDSYAAAQMLLPIVPLSDLRAFLDDFSDPSVRWGAALLALAPSHLYASDLQDFLLHPVTRLDMVRARNAVGVKYLYVDVRQTDTMDDLKIDPATQTIVKYPARFNALFRADIADKFRAPPVDWAKQRTARNAAFSRKWLGRIADAYKDSKTKLIFVDMPYEPFDLPSRRPIEGAPDIRDMLPKRANIFVLPPETFADLQRPHNFLDLDHMNVYGKEQFSRRLGQVIIDVMAQRVAGQDAGQH